MPLSPTKLGMVGNIEVKRKVRILRYHRVPWWVFLSYKKSNSFNHHHHQRIANKMSSGHGINGSAGRCYPFFAEFKECLVSTQRFCRM